MRLNEKKTILAIDPTLRGLAYAVFEEGQLLDWGRSQRTSKYDDLALLDRLIAHYGADILVVEDPDASCCRRGARVKRLLRSAREYAEMRRLKARAVRRVGVRDSWRAAGCRTSESIAARIAELFPVLQPLVPKPRKSYMPEDERVRVFGAIALALAATRSFPPRLVS